MATFNSVTKRGSYVDGKGKMGSEAVIAGQPRFTVSTILDDNSSRRKKPKSTARVLTGLP